MRNLDRVYLETRIRNLERRYARLIQHPDLTDIAVEVREDIKRLEKELQ